MAPSLVTWPTMTTLTPVLFAKRTSCAVHSLSCVIAPAAVPIEASCTVWMESTMSSFTPSSRARAIMASRSVSATTRRCEPPTPSRRARKPICATDSSADRYSVGVWPAAWFASCSSSVDLPMPGSPPSNVTEPGISPPPRTRSSSPMPVSRRGSSVARSARSVDGDAADAGPGRTTRHRPLLQGVPVRALRALTLPFEGLGAAVGADEDDRRFGHPKNLGRGARKA